MFTNISIRFNLAQDKIKRNFKDGKRLGGTQQMVAIISFYPPVKITVLPDGARWVKPLGKTPGYITYGWGDMAKSPEQRKKMISNNKSLGGYKVNAAGDLIKYERIKLNTGLYILKEAWNTKEQDATAPYEAINNELIKIKHIIETTFQELIQRADFSVNGMLTEIKHRIKNGMPVNIVIPVNKATAPAKTFELIEKQLKKHQGIPVPDENNRKGVPEDLREFIPYYHKNRKKPKKLDDTTIDRHIQFQHKLQRWYEATGKILTLTGSDIDDIADFMLWRIYDNEENNVRHTKKIKSKSQISRIKPYAVGVGTLNKTKKDIKYFYNRAAENYSCILKFNTKNDILKEQAYDREKSDIYLTMEQLLKIINLPLEKGSRIEKHRSLFILGCLGGGYRISDLVKLPKPEYEEFDDGEFYYTFKVTSTKTNARTMAPIPPELNYLVESYNFQEDTIDQDFRDDINELGNLCEWTHLYKYEMELADGTFKPEEKPFFKMMMPRTCRKTYCSLLFNYWELPIRECMDFSGHKSEDEFRKYLLIDKKYKAQNLVKRFKANPIII